MKKLSLLLSAGLVLGASGVCVAIGAAHFQAPSLQGNGVQSSEPTVSKIAKAAYTETGEPAAEEKQWLEVTVESAGSLGVEVLYKDGIETLADVKHLRVTGPLNGTDLITIKNMSALQSLDLTATTGITSLPNEWKRYSVLSEIHLPATLRSIGEYAFSETRLTEISIPAEVTTLFRYAFYRCTELVTVSFAEGSKLTTIYPFCFQDCTKLHSISLPDNVLSIPSYCFERCTALENLKLPSRLIVIDNDAFSQCTTLKNVVFPESLSTINARAFYGIGLEAAYLPESLSTIGQSAFGYCSSLVEVTLPAKRHSYTDNQFYGCNALMKINCPTATPPAANNNGIKFNAGATVSVPDVAVVNYKLDSFWKNFNVQGGFNADYYEINGDMLLTNDRRIDGTPEIYLYGSAKMTIGGNSPQKMSSFTMQYDPRNTSSPVFAQFINNSPAVSAEVLKLKMNVNNSTWYFFSIPFTCRVADVTADSGAAFALRYYDGAARAANGTGGSWKDCPEDGVIEAGRGYIIQTNANCTVTFAAKADEIEAYFNPNVRTLDLALNECENLANAGWNLIGTPFQCYYDMYYSMLTCPVIMWDASNRKYVTYSLADDNVVLPPYRPFFVQASVEMEKIQFSTAGRQFDATVSRPAAAPAYAKAASGRQLFNLTLQAGDRSDRTRIVLNEEATLYYDLSRDASKFLSDDETVAELYTIDTDGNRLAINERPEADGAVRLGLRLPAAGKFSIGADLLDGEAELVDALTGEIYTLQEGQSLEFESDSEGFIDNRFSVRMKAISTGVDCLGAVSAVKVAASVGGISISSGESLPFSVVCVNGALAACGVCSAEQFIPLAKGVYIVRIGDKTAKCIVK